MKKLTNLLLCVTIIGLYSASAIAQKKAKPSNVCTYHCGFLNQFYVHGWTSTTDAITPLANWCDLILKDWKSNPVIPGYNSYTATFFNNWNSVFLNLLQAHPEGEYIGLGYSAGGLITRAIAQNTTQCPDGCYNSFMSGFVTLDAINAGALIGLRWNSYLYKMVGAYAEIFRGAWSFLGPAFATVVGLLYTAFAIIGDIYQGLGGGMTQDITFGSATIAAINSSNGIMKERALLKGWAAVYGKIDASPNGHRYRQPGFSANGDNSSINTAMDNYQSLIDQAFQNAADYDQKANTYSCHCGFFSFFVNWIVRGWDRMRANDWRACAQGYQDANDGWEWATADRQTSDGFIPVSSQTFSAPSGQTYQIINNINHGGAEAAGSILDADTQGANGVRRAMTTGLGLTAF